MERQLVLLEGVGADRRLDERTRELGRRGVAHAREILQRAAERAAAEAAATGRPNPPTTTAA